MSATALPRYPVMVLILGALACIGPMSIDAYLPAFGAIGREFGVAPERVQHTLGFYMVAYAVMTLFHGTFSDSFGRRRVILASLAVYALGSLLAAAAPSFEWLLAGRVLQGLSAGAGMVVGQAVVHDCYQGSTAQKTLSYIIMVFGVSPALAPIIGGYFTATLGWRAVFVMLVVLAVFTAALCALRLPETMPAARRHRFSAGTVAGNFARVLRDRTFMAMALAFGSLFGGFAFLIGAAPDFVTVVLGLPETGFGYLFVPLVAGMMSGSLLAARLAARWEPPRLIALAYAVLGASCASNVAYHALAAAPAYPWAVLPLALFSFGLSLAIPNMTLTALRRMREIAGTAASVLGFVQMLLFSIVSGWLVPVVYGAPLRLALALGAGVVVSGAGWWAIGRFMRAGETRPGPGAPGERLEH